MHLLDLPTELLGDIIKLLDTKSKLRLWETGCERLRSAARRGDVMGRVSLARCNLHLFELETWLTDSLADCIVELDLHGRSDVDSQRAIAMVRKLPNLRSLDIARTSISMWEACDVLAVCPRLVRLAVSFDWPNIIEDLFPRGDEHCRAQVERCRHAFHSLQAIHLFGNLDVMECIHPFEMLQNSPNLTELQVTSDDSDEYAFGIEKHHMDCEARSGPLLKLFNFHFHNSYNEVESFLSKPLMKWFNLENWQMLVMTDLNCNPRALMTKKLYDEAINMASGDRFSLLDLQSPLAISSPADVYMWHVELEDLNPDLYKKIYHDISERFPQIVCKKTLQNVNRQADVYAINYCVLETALTFEMAKRRTLDKTKCSFNPDTFVESKRPLKIFLNDCDYSCRYRSTTPTLYIDPDSVMLKYLSFLAIRNTSVDVSFFECLFEVCSRLETLVLHNDFTDHQSLTETIHLAKFIKCVQIHGPKMSINELLQSLALCSNLEIIRISNWKHYEKTYLPVRLIYYNLFNNCRKLCELSLSLDLLPVKHKEMMDKIEYFLQLVDKPQYVNIKIIDSLNHYLVSDCIVIDVNKKIKLC